MKSVDLLKHESDLAFSELLTTLEGVTEGQAWAILPQGGTDYLNTDGSIHGIVLHLASCKRMYGSVGFRNTEIRWRDCGDDMERFEPSWTAALDYLNESHRYWLTTWAALEDADLDVGRPHFRGVTWPAWKIIARMIQHDSYHAGQIAVLRYATGESDMPPPSAAADIRKSCPDLPSW
jgi:uncharacterized damage-inducible protein DinB